MALDGTRQGWFTIGVKAGQRGQEDAAAFAPWRAAILGARQVPDMR